MVHSIHPRTIQEVKEKADIVDVISEHIVLKKKGKEFVGICPFHDDTKPSMTVSPSKQFYYCFSCGAGGNSIKFLIDQWYYYIQITSKYKFISKTFLRCFKITCWISL